ERAAHNNVLAVTHGVGGPNGAFNRPYGTLVCRHNLPSSELLGYSQPSLRDEKLRAVCRYFSASAARIPRTILRSFGSAMAAFWRMTEISTGCRASGRHISVTQERPSARRPAWAATSTSGTVDMPTASAPIIRRKRYSARVSRFGPVTATKTPLWAA